MFIERTFTNPTYTTTTVTVTNALTGQVREAVVPSTVMTGPQIHRFLNGAMVQDAFPLLNTVEREFILSGMTVAEQSEVFGNVNKAMTMRFTVVDK